VLSNAVRGRRDRRRGASGDPDGQVRLAALLDGSLQPGTYQVLLRAYDAAGNRSPDIMVKFWVLADGRASSKNRRRSR
jgi:hypothetical protein